VESKFMRNAKGQFIKGEKNYWEGKHFFEEYKRKLSEAHKGKKVSEETKRKMSEAHSGEKNHNFGKHWKCSEDTKIRIGNINRGKKLSEEHKRKISESEKGKKVSEETRRKLSEIGKIKNKGRISWIKGKHHTEETRRKMSNSRKGKKTWNWKGGITPINERIRKGIECRLWRESVFARDNWTCQKTGIKGGKLHAHHINNFADFPESRTSIENGITLSDKAHKEFHKIYGVKNNTREQLEEFLKL
jgi:hypothetical protein